MTVPRKWWWSVAIVVPLAVAAIGSAPALLGPDASENPNLVYNQVDGPQFQGDVVFNPVTYIQNQAQQASGEALPANVVALLEDAMRAVGDGAADKAVPLFQAAAEVAPTPSVLNNLGAAYLAAGDRDRAREVLLQAKAADSRLPEETAALEHNLRQIAAAPSFGGPTQPTEWPGVVARVTRFDDAGGLVTFEVEYGNNQSAAVEVCIRPSDNYLLDETSGTRWDDQHNGGQLCYAGGEMLAPGQTG